MELEASKQKFIELRAEGRSYRYIAKALDISKSTCGKWEQALKEHITRLKQDQLRELFTAYQMTKAARIKRIGETLNRITTALASVDLTSIAPEKLLDYHLKYTEALKAEYVTFPTAHNDMEPSTAGAIIAALEDLLARVREGEVTTEQASREAQVLSTLLKAYDTGELKEKLETLESILDRRAV